MPVASILVPTHDHGATLPLAVGSALAQSVTDIEVLIVGDGITEGVRTAAQELCGRDERVRLLELPKGPHHGEIHRDAAIRAADSDAIFYLCDDDLLLPRHVENLTTLLESADLVQCRNGFINPAGELWLYPTNLHDPEAIAWHVSEPLNNATSLTGTAHTKRAYLTLAEGWSTTPRGQFPDHYMWKKFFRRPGFRGATHPEMTAIQLPTSGGRAEWDQSARVAELRRWWERLDRPDAHEWFQGLVREATARQLDREYRARTVWEARAVECKWLLDSAQEELVVLRASLADVRASFARSQAEHLARQEILAGVLRSASWRMTAPARRLGEAWRRRRRVV